MAILSGLRGLRPNQDGDTPIPTFYRLINESGYLKDIPIIHNMIFNVLHFVQQLARQMQDYLSSSFCNVVFWEGVLWIVLQRFSVDVSNDFFLFIGFIKGGKIRESSVGMVFRSGLVIGFQACRLYVFADYLLERIVPNANHFSRMVLPVCFLVALLCVTSQFCTHCSGFLRNVLAVGHTPSATSQSPKEQVISPSWLFFLFTASIEFLLCLFIMPFCVAILIGLHIFISRAALTIEAPIFVGDQKAS